MTRTEMRKRVLQKIAESSPRKANKVLAQWLLDMIEKPQHRTDEQRVLMVLASDYLHRKDMLV